MIDKIEIIKRSKVRRSKLYYIRDKVAREIKRQMRNARFMDLSTLSDIEEKARIKREEEEAQAKAEEEEKKKVEETSSEDAENEQKG